MNAFAWIAAASAGLYAGIAAIALAAIVAAAIAAAWANQPQRHADPDLDQRLALQREAADQARRLP